MRFTVFERLRREIETERHAHALRIAQSQVRRERDAIHVAKNRARCRDYYIRQHYADIDEWNQAARERAKQDTCRAMLQASGAQFGFVSQLHPDLWRYHLDPLLCPNGEYERNP